MITGLIQLLAGWQAESWRKKLASLIHGGIATVGGIAVMAHPFYGLAALSLVLAFFFAAEGVWKIFTSFSYRPVPGWIALLMSGVLDFILGILIWRQWPVSGLWAVGILVGVNLLSTGMAFVALAITWKRTVHVVKNKIEIAKEKLGEKFLPGHIPLRKFSRALSVVSPTNSITYRFRVLFGGTRPEATLSPRHGSREQHQRDCGQVRGVG